MRCSMADFFVGVCVCDGVLCVFTRFSPSTSRMAGRMTRMVVLCEMMKSIWAKWWYLVCVSLVCV